MHFPKKPLLGLLVSTVAIVIFAWLLWLRQPTDGKPIHPPEGAIWVGGVDGGVFVKLEKKSPKLFHGTIYTQGGEVWYRGNFKLVPSESSVAKVDDPSIFQGWDGDTLYLTGNRQLKTSK